MTKPVMEEGGSVFLDPMRVGSSIRWGVSVTRYEPKKDGRSPYLEIETEISLSDCTRIINWSDYSSNDKSNQLMKVDKAIKELKAYRAALVRAQKLYAKEPQSED